MDKVRILAFDPGTQNTGYAVLNGSLKTGKAELTKHFGVLKTTKHDGEIRERIDILGAGMKNLIDKLEPTHVAIEDFVEQGKFVGKTYKEMAFLIEHMRMAGRERGYEVSIYENGAWKKQTMRATRVNKTQVQHFISHKLPNAKKILNKQPDHVWDSVGIAYCEFLLLMQGVK